MKKLVWISRFLLLFVVIGFLVLGWRNQRWQLLTEFDPDRAAHRVVIGLSTSHLDLFANDRTRDAKEDMRSHLLHRAERKIKMGWFDDATEDIARVKALRPLAIVDCVILSMATTDEGYRSTIDGLYEEMAGNYSHPIGHTAYSRYLRGRHEGKMVDALVRATEQCEQALQCVPRLPEEDQAHERLSILREFVRVLLLRHEFTEAKKRAIEAKGIVDAMPEETENEQEFKREFQKEIQEFLSEADGLVSTDS